MHNLMIIIITNWGLVLEPIILLTSSSSFNFISFYRHHPGIVAGGAVPVHGQTQVHWLCNRFFRFRARLQREHFPHRRDPHHRPRSVEYPVRKFLINQCFYCPFLKIRSLLNTHKLRERERERERERDGYMQYTYR